jgi:hydroxymethylpyrimidine/phosphomethylpyrimidine kinase
MGHKPLCLTIAGLDPSGGAGIIADIETLTSFGCVPAAVITSITFQNSTGISGALHQSGETVRRQLDAVFSEFDVAAIKIGMLPTAEVVNAVVATLSSAKPTNVVIDPVIRSTSGFDLVDDDAIGALPALFPLAGLVTPNIPEAERLTGIKIATEQDISAAAQDFRSRGARNLLIKGGHFETNSNIARDFLFSGEKVTIFEGPRVGDPNVRGTGCRLSSAIAANLALGSSLEDAVGIARKYVFAKLQLAASRPTAV